MLRRWRTYWIRRSRTGWVPPAAAPPTPPPYPPANIDQPGWRPRWPRLRLARGRTIEPPWPAVTSTAPAWVPEGVQQPRRVAAIWRRRGRATSVPVEQVGPPPATIHADVRLGGMRRRGRATAAPLEQPGPPPTLLARRRWSPLVRRGRSTAVVLVPPVGGGGVPVPETIRRPDPRWLFQRRGRATALPLVGAAAPPLPTWTPQTLRVDVRLAGVRRGQTTEPPWPVGEPVPMVVRRRRSTVPLCRRGQVTEPPWPQTVVQPSVWRPSPVRQAGWHPRWPTHRTRRGRLAEPIWPFVPPPPFTVGTLVATDAATATLTMADAAATLGATGTAGLDAATDQATGTLTATDKAGGPS
jgi:hypothetical protein